MELHSRTVFFFLHRCCQWHPSPITISYRTKGVALEVKSTSICKNDCCAPGCCQEATLPDRVRALLFPQPFDDPDDFDDIGDHVEGVYLDEHDIQVFVDYDICPLGKAVGFPEKSVLGGNVPVRPEIAEKRGMGYAERPGPGLLAGDRVHTETDRIGVELVEPLLVLLKGLHLGGADRSPRERVEGEEDPPAHMLVQAKRLVLVIFQREVFRLFPGLDYRYLVHTIHPQTGLLAFQGYEGLYRSGFSPERSVAQRVIIPR